jgi:D-3-phosphoglycerate dehydrogenase
MKTLIIDAFPEGHLDALRRLGLEVDYQPQLKAEALPAAIGGAAILITRSTEVRKEAIERASALTLIIRAGAGVNTIDREEASARGIYVANCPGKNSIAVAELTMGLLLSLDRRIPDQVRDLRAGRWNKKEYSKAQGLYGRTLGIVGLGAIGLEVAARARAFGLRVVAWSRSLTDQRAVEAGVFRARTVPELCGEADAVTVHLALNAETRGLVGEAAIARLRPGALLVNTSRAEVVDTVALQRAVADKGLRVALDVFSDEPKESVGEFADALGRHASVYGTHHVGASTEQAQLAVASEAVYIVRRFLERGEVLNCVNVDARSRARFQLLVRHIDKVGVLAEVLGAIRRHALNVQEMENTIFEGGHAASAKILLGVRPPLKLLEEIRSRTEEIIHVDLVELPT